MAIEYDAKFAGTWIDYGGRAYNVHHPSFAGGAVGDGVADDRAALAAADAAGPAEGSPGKVYRIGANLRLENGWRPNHSMLKPASGVTVMVAGPVEAGAYQWIETSHGGKVELPGSQEATAHWWPNCTPASSDVGPALNAAIASLSNGGTVSIRRGRYNAQTPVAPRSGVAFDGCCSTLVIPAVVGTQRTVFQYTVDGITDVAVRNVEFESANSQPRAAPANGVSSPDPSSNVYAIHLAYCDGITLENLAGRNLAYLIKCDMRVSNVTMNDIRATGCNNPVYLGGVQGLSGRNWRLDRTGFTDRYDHCIYIDSGPAYRGYPAEGCRDLYLHDLVLTDPSSYPLQIKSEDARSPSTNVNVDGLRITGVKGVAVQNTQHVRISGYDAAIKSGDAYLIATVNGTDDVTVDGFSLSGGGSLFAAISGTSLSDGQIYIRNGSVASSPLTAMISIAGVRGLTVENVTFLDAGSQDGVSRFVGGGEQAVYGSFIMRNCTVLFPNGVKPVPISIRGKGSAVLFENNVFINSGAVYPELTLNAAAAAGSPTILFRNNYIKGFAALRFAGDNADVYVFNNQDVDVMTNSVAYAIAQPSIGAYHSGDIVFNVAAAVKGSGGFGTPNQKYNVIGWRRLTTGSRHEPNTDWAELRALTGE